MKYHDQRRAALALAKEAGATKTLRTILSGGCFEDIYRDALNEVGLDALVSYILQGDPEWAFHALRYIPNLGAHRDALLQKSAATPEVALQTLRAVPDLGSHAAVLTATAGFLADPVGRISSLSLINDGGFVCAFTMRWINNGVTQPQGTTGSPVVWSPNMDLNFNPLKEPCSFFASAPSTAPLQTGNEVWMYVWVESGKDNESTFRFTFDPNTDQTANFVITGGVDNNELGFTGIK